MVTIGAKEIVWQEGLTVAQVLAQIEDGSRFAVVKLNGKLISRPNFHKTAVDDHAEIVPLPMIAGG
jgi:sulfur carrier protein ThiS